MARVMISLLAMTSLAPCLCHGAAGGDEFEDDPEARATYDGMIKALREAESLHCESDYRWEARPDRLRQQLAP